MNTNSYEEKTVMQGKNRDRFFLQYRINRFPERLKAAMDRAEIPSNNQLAKKTELSETTIRKYLKGDTYPTLDRLALLAEACSCSLAWLASGEGDSATEKNAIIEKNEPAPHKNECGESEFDVILSYLSDQQKKAFLKVIYTKGISSILQLDDGLDAQLQALSEEEKLRLLRLNEQLKKGASEGSGLNEDGSLASNNKRAG